MPLCVYVSFKVWWLNQNFQLVKQVPSLQHFHLSNRVRVYTHAAIITWLMPQQWISCSHWEPGWRKPTAILPAWKIHPHCILGWRLLPGASLPVPELELSLIDTCFGRHLQREKQNPLRLQTPFWPLQKLPDAPHSYREENLKQIQGSKHHYLHINEAAMELAFRISKTTINLDNQTMSQLMKSCLIS